jgi:hypothetical protein
MVTVGLICVALGGFLIFVAPGLRSAYHENYGLGLRWFIISLPLPYIGAGLILIGTPIFIYGLYESARSKEVMAIGIRVTACATEVETNAMGGENRSPLYYLNYHYSDESGKQYLGQVVVRIDEDAHAWMRRLRAGESALEVIYNPNSPGEHVALFLEALKG